MKYLSAEPEQPFWVPCSGDWGNVVQNQHSTDNECERKFMSDAMVCCKDPTVWAVCSCAELLVPGSEQAAGANTLKDATLISSLTDSVLPSGAGLMRCRQDGGQGWKNPSWRRAGGEWEGPKEARCFQQVHPRGHWRLMFGKSQNYTKAHSRSGQK